MVWVKQLHVWKQPQKHDLIMSCFTFKQEISRRNDKPIMMIVLNLNYKPVALRNRHLEGSRPEKNTTTRLQPPAIPTLPKVISWIQGELSYPCSDGSGVLKSVGTLSNLLERYLITALKKKNTYCVVSEFPVMQMYDVGANTIQEVLRVWNEYKNSLKPGKKIRHSQLCYMSMLLPFTKQLKD